MQQSIKKERLSVHTIHGLIYLRWKNFFCWISKTGENDYIGFSLGGRGGGGGGGVFHPPPPPPPYQPTVPHTGVIVHHHTASHKIHDNYFALF